MKYIISLIRLLFLAAFILVIYEGKMVIWLILFGISLIAALFFGRIYCGYACPMNTLMILTENLSKKLKLQRDTIPNFLSEKIPWLTFMLSIAFILLWKKIIHRDIPILLIWLVISILITLIYKPHVFHNYICPFGAFQKVFGRFAKLSERVNEESCVGCKLCEKSCPTDAIKVNNKKAYIETNLCIQCTNCKEVCPKDAIRYKK